MWHKLCVFLVVLLLSYKNDQGFKNIYLNTYKITKQI